ncbi:hypothetical protein [Mycolicibacterium iranicum]|uniref:hypothetical protein n=1 Tax=Mycolicibacterium iranicum TaxID=912594 RepID=UPI001F1930AD|nr:hypothetical protein [Mycolicibacterium iranicum]
MIGTVRLKSPRNSATATAMIDPITMTVVTPASGRTYFEAPKRRPDEDPAGAAPLVVLDRCLGPGPRFLFNASP